MTDFVGWYAVYTKSRCEKRVHTQLENKGVKSFLPLVERRRRWKDRRVKIQLPLFTSYLFVHIDYRFRIPVLETPGVVKLVSFAGKPARIPESEIEAIKLAIEHPQTLRLERYINIGEPVEVVAGPFEGVTGKLIYYRGKNRVVISIDSIMQSISVEVDREDLKPLKNSPSC